MVPTLGEFLYRVETPAFVYDASCMRAAAEELLSLLAPAGGRLLYSTKALGFFDVLRTIAPYVTGLSVSSFYEAKLAREAIGTHGSVHFVSPGIRPIEFRELADSCDFLTLNSLSQLQRFTPFGGVSVGIRVNPEIDFVNDARVSPCGPNSKLGVPIRQLKQAKTLADLSVVRGLHLHSNCDSTQLHELWRTVELVVEQLEWLLSSIDWINLGGGYCVAQASDRHMLTKTVDFLRNRFDIDVFFEPGAAVVQDSGVLISTVIDAFSSDTSEILVLDTSVNHLPDVFSFQSSPDVLNSNPAGTYCYSLVGSTCLSGDRFGEYGFNEPIGVGSRVVFTSAGAYCWVKSHTFNGLPIPNLYMVDEGGGLRLLRSFTYDDYALLQGSPTVACVRRAS